MDQKHAMLYPDFQSTADQRALASNAIGLPTDPRDLQNSDVVHQQEPPPPSYDAAVFVGATTSNVTDNWYAPNSVSFQQSPNTQQPTADIQQHNASYGQQFSRDDVNSRSFSNPNLPAVNVITQQHFPKLGPHPCTVFCPSCGTARMTRMAYTPNTRTHFCAFLLCLVGWCCCACFVPYCTNSCRTGNHYCAVCSTFLGSYNAQENHL